MANKRIIRECNYFTNDSTYKNFLFRLSLLSKQQRSHVIKSRNFPPDIARQISEEVKCIIQRRKEREKCVCVRQKQPRKEEPQKRAEKGKVDMTPIGREIDERKVEQWRQSLAALEEELDGYEEQMRAGVLIVPFRVINDIQYRVAVLRKKLEQEKKK